MVSERLDVEDEGEEDIKHDDWNFALWNQMPSDKLKYPL